MPMFEGVSETNTYILNLICIKTARDSRKKKEKIQFTEKIFHYSLAYPVFV